jgi:hypothetical protein
VWPCTISGVDYDDNLLLCGSHGPIWTAGLLGAPIIDKDGCVHGVVTSLHGADRPSPIDTGFWFALPNRGGHSPASRSADTASPETPPTTKPASFATMVLTDQVRRLVWRPNSYNINVTNGERERKRERERNALA